MSETDGDIINLFDEYPDEVVDGLQDDLLSWLKETARKENIPVRRLIRRLFGGEMKRTGTE